MESVLAWGGLLQALGGEGPPAATEAFLGWLSFGGGGCMCPFHTSPVRAETLERRKNAGLEAGPGLSHCLASPLFSLRKGSTCNERFTSQALESASTLALPLPTVNFDVLGPGPQFPHL